MRKVCVGISKGGIKETQWILWIQFQEWQQPAVYLWYIFFAAFMADLYDE